MHYASSQREWVIIRPSLDKEQLIVTQKITVLFMYFSLESDYTPFA